jgi:probable FeS assembly SUF system protein SufT
MVKNETIVLTRDCDGLLVPAATPIFLEQGTEVVVTQSLGGSYTVLLNGNLIRIDGKDADALGVDTLATPEYDASMDIESIVWAQLKTCFDPEIPVNVVDLGLIYHCEITPLPNDPTAYQVIINMTLTAPGCGMGPVLTMDIQQKLLAVESIKTAEVTLVFEPMWNQSMMSDAAKLQLGMF